MDILPVHYDPKDRRYVVDHKYLSAELGERVVKDAQTINQALGYEMNTIEFAIQDGVPYAIDFLNPAPDFERDRITEFYFEQVVDKMARLVIDRALRARLPIRGRAGKEWSRPAREAGHGARRVHRRASGQERHKRRRGNTAPGTSSAAQAYAADARPADGQSEKRNERGVATARGHESGGILGRAAARVAGERFAAWPRISPTELRAAETNFWRSGALSVPAAIFSFAAG